MCPASLPLGQTTGWSNLEGWLNKKLKLIIMANRSGILADRVTGEKIVMTVLGIVSFADQGILHLLLNSCVHLI